MAIFLNDDFNRTSPAFLHGSTASTIGGVWSAVASSNGTGSPAMPGGYAALSGDITLFHQNAAAPASADYTVPGVFTAVADNWQFALLSRIQPDGSYYQFFLSPGGARIDRKTSSDGTVGTQIGASSTNVSIPAGDRTAHTLTFTVNGTSLSATVDGVAVQFGAGITTLTDSNITAAGVAGMGGRQANIDSLVGDTLGGGSTPVSFSGPVPTINATVGTAGSVDLASYFSGSLTPFTYSTFAGTLPTGFSRTGSVISWTTGTTAATTTGIQIRATDTGSNVATTNAFDIVVAAAPAAPTINTQPSNQTVTTPAAATFTVSASGTGLSYQWQRNPGGNTSFANISGATSASYTTGATAVTGGNHNNGDTYRVVVSNAGGSVTSNAATLTANAPSSTGTLTLTSPLCNNTGQLSGLWVNQTGITLTVLPVSTKASVLVVTGRATNASGVLTSAITDAAITAGQTYRVVPWLGSEAGISQVLTAT